MSLRDMGEMLDVKVNNIPCRLALFFLVPLEKLKIIKKPYSGWVRIAKHPIIVDSTKAKQELGWTPNFDTPGLVKHFYEYVQELEEN